MTNSPFLHLHAVTEETDVLQMLWYKANLSLYLLGKGKHLVVLSL